jgi:hypothetical protein
MKHKHRKPVTVKKEWQTSLDGFFLSSKITQPAGSYSTSATATTSTVNLLNGQQVPESENIIESTSKKRARGQEEEEEGEEEEGVTTSSGKRKLRTTFDLPFDNESEPPTTANSTMNEATPLVIMPDIQMAEMSLSDKQDVEIIENNNRSPSNVTPEQVQTLAVGLPEIIDLEDTQETTDINMPDVPNLKIEEGKEQTKVSFVEELTEYSVEFSSVTVKNAGAIDPSM